MVVFIFLVNATRTKADNIVFGQKILNQFEGKDQGLVKKDLFGY